MTRTRTPLRWSASIASLALAMSVASPVHASATLLNGLGGPAGYGSNREDLNDDGSSPQIDLTPAFPSGLLFFGMSFSSTYVNNNGNITFGASLYTYTPQAFPVSSQRMIAPWWGDVDTRNGSLADGTHDAVFWDVRAGQFTATWHNVGYYSQHDDMQNDFQLILRTFAGCGVGNFDVEMRYHQCEWVAGDASGGANGHGGTAAQAGFDAGDLVHFYALPNSLTEMVVNLCTTSNQTRPDMTPDVGVWRFRIRGGELPCNGSGGMCDTGMMGACQAGTTECRSGAPVCIQNVPSSPERCDGVDNNCDGMVDNGTGLCPAGDVCYLGNCVPTCVEGACFAGQTCSPTGACIDNTCLNVTCPAGQRCQGGACVDACAGITCPIGTVCRTGGCVAPCDGVTCATGEVCEGGVCQVNCMCRDCPTNYSCSPDGSCQPTDCVGMNCPTGQVCASGLLGEVGTAATCVDPCSVAVCPGGQYCTGGRCVVGTNPNADAGTGSDGGVSTGDGSTSSGPDGSVTGRDGGVRAGDGGNSDGSTLGGRDKGSCGCSVPGGQRGGGSWAFGALCAGFAIMAGRRRRNAA